MDTFVIGTRRAWCIRAMGHNALVRPIDRIEAWSLVAAVLILAAATSVVCAFGTSLYEVRSSAYSLEAQHRHLVTATAIEVSDPVYQPDTVTYASRARWYAAGHEYADTIQWPDRARNGDQQRIWVDDEGRKAPPPRDSRRAAVDATVLAFTIWLGLCSAVAGVMYGVHWRLDIRRLGQWDREIDQISRYDRRNPQ